MIAVHVALGLVSERQRDGRCQRMRQGRHQATREGARRREGQVARETIGQVRNCHGSDPLNKRLRQHHGRPAQGALSNFDRQRLGELPRGGAGDSRKRHRHDRIVDLLLDLGQRIVHRPALGIPRLGLRLRIQERLHHLPHLLIRVCQRPCLVLRLKKRVRRLARVRAGAFGARLLVEPRLGQLREDGKREAALVARARRRRQHHGRHRLPIASWGQAWDGAGGRHQQRRQHAGQGLADHVDHRPGSGGGNDGRDHFGRVVDDLIHDHGERLARLDAHLQQRRHLAAGLQEGQRQLPPAHCARRLDRHVRRPLLWVARVFQLRQGRSVRRIPIRDEERVQLLGDGPSLEEHVLLDHVLRRSHLRCAGDHVKQATAQLVAMAALAALAACHLGGILAQQLGRSAQHAGGVIRVCEHGRVQRLRADDEPRLLLASRGLAGSAAGPSLFPLRLDLLLHERGR
mmetsp:Transcript_24649/g.79339  ORF Transcript_24649/g.79339 Transcript_24649/m.79339 type:complete len:459 (-) Transcript_24649:1071-2447(-)